MTRDELRKELFMLVKDWRDVDKIFALFGKLSPEPKPKLEAPPLSADMLKKAKRLTERFQFTDEQAAAARDILRGVDLYE